MSLPTAAERPLLRPDDLQELLGLKRSAVYEAMKRGELPSLRIGRRVYVPTAELRQLLGLAQ